MTRTTPAVLIGLLVAAGFVPMGAAQDPEPGQELVFSDAAGDAGSFQIGPLGAVPPADAFDLISFRLYGEDSEGLFIEIGVKDLKAIPNELDTFGNAPAVFETQFKVDGSNVFYFLTIYAPMPQAGTTPAGTQPASTFFCVSSGGRGGCANQRAIGTVDWDKSKLTTYIPKASLLGKDPVAGVDRQPAGLPGLLPGTRLAAFVVQSRANFPYFNSDRMPDAGLKGPYVLAHPAANDRIRLRLTTPLPMTCPPLGGGCVQDYPQVSVSPDSTALVQVTVENLNGNKRIIDLAAAPLEAAGAGKWEIRVLNKLTVPGSESRVVNLIVNVSKTAEHRESILARVSAKSVGFADEIGSLRVRLVASIPPRPRAGDLFLHAKAPQSASLSVCTSGICGQGTNVPWMNTLEKDPRATGDGGIPMRQAGVGGLNTEADYVAVFRLDTPLNADLVLNPNDRVTAALNFRTQFPTQGTVRLDLQSDAVSLGSGSAPFSASGPTTVSFAPLVDASRIPAGSTLTARVVLRTGPPIGFFTTQFNPQIVPQGSKITLPVIPDPTPKNKAIPLGPAFLTLSPTNESEQFVNPDKIKVFEVTLVNEGVQEDLVTITPEIAVEGVEGDPNWYLDIRPGNKYRLKPGDSATFGVLVRPPEEAAEGDQAHITLNATSSVDPGALAQTFLTAIVTRGVEIEDEGENFTADADTIEHYEYESGGSSPGPSSVAAVGISIMVVLGRRWRGLRKHSQG